MVLNNSKSDTMAAENIGSKKIEHEHKKFLSEDFNKFYCTYCFILLLVVRAVACLSGCVR